MELHDPTFEQLVEVHNAKKVFIHQNLYEFCTWLNILKKINPKVYVEIGTYKLGSAQLAVDLLPSLDLLITVDIHDLASEELEKLKQYDKIVFIKGDSGTIACFRQVQDVLRGRVADAVFIDGNHTLNGVIRDFVLYGQITKMGGLIGMHDCLVMEGGQPLGKPASAQNSDWKAIGVHCGEFWQLLSKRYPTRCRLLDAELGPWGNYGIGVYTKSD